MIAVSPAHNSPCQNSVSKRLADKPIAAKQVVGGGDSPKKPAATSTEKGHIKSLKGAAPSRFLVIGCGYDQNGDEAAGLRVAKTVENWQLSSVKTLGVSQLSPKHAAEIANADYVIFVEACGSQRGSRKVQIEPVVGDFQPLRPLFGRACRLNPWTLLNLTEQQYGQSPQAWRIKVPAEQVDQGSALSVTAQIGCDRAITTIAKFIQTY